MSRVARLEAAVTLALLTLSLVLRLMDLDVFIASDELKWTCRSLGFREALVSGDWASTFRVGHPGVITTWLGTLALPWDSGTAVETCLRTQDASLPARAGETPQEQTQRLAELGQLLFQGRVGVAVFTWLCLVAAWALTWRAMSPGVALLGLAMVGLDPFLLAHSRFLHLDAVAAMLTLVALTSLLTAGLEVPPRRRRFFLLLSGGVAGLAMLQKSPSLFLGPFAALVMAFAAFKERAGEPFPWRRLVTDLMLWSLSAVAVYVALWPAMWVNPVGTLQRMLAKAVGYAQEGHESGSFFFGHLGDDPGPLFYPVALAFRLTPMSLLGLGGFLVGLLHQRSTVKDEALRRERRAVAILLVFAVAFVAFMTSGAKKFDRYALPALVALDLTAVIGLVWLARTLTTVLEQRIMGSGGRGKSSLLCPSAPLPPCPLAQTSAVVLVVLVAIVQLAVTLPHHPYYLTAYNPLLGGARMARRAILVGWGEGYDRVAAYLNALPDAEKIQATVRGMSNFAPLFVGETRSVTGYRAWQSDYVVFYVSNIQRRHNVDLLDAYSNPGIQPEHIVRLAGVDYAWIYRNGNWRAPLDHVTRRSRQGDALMTNGTSLIAKHYQGDLPRLDVFGHWGALETAELLRSLPASVERIWYARYPAADAQSVLDVLHRRALRENHEIFPEVDLYLYRLVGEPAPLKSAIIYAEPGQEPILQLHALGVSDGELNWGRDNLILLGWESLRRADSDYCVRLRLMNPDGYTWAETVEPVLDEALQPTSSWEPGVEVTDAHRLAPPAGIPPGFYRLQVEVLKPGEEPLSTTGEALQRLSVEVGEPVRVVTLDDLEISQQLEQRLGPLTLLGMRVEDEVAVAGAHLPLNLAWQMPQEALSENLRLRLELRGLNGATWSTWEGELPAGVQGLIRTGHNLLVNSTASGGATRVFVILQQPSGEQETEAGPVAVIAPAPRFEVPTEIQYPHAARLGDRVRFLGYDASTLALSPAETLALTLYWQAGGPVSPPQKVFVHLVGPDGQIHGQKDNPPLLGRRPTGGWQPGEVLADPYLVWLEPTAPPGSYMLTIGMYDPVSGTRLSAFDAEGEPLPENRIVLGGIQVED